MKNLFYMVVASLLLFPSQGIAESDMDIQLDTRMGYSVISDDENSFYRNHMDLTEGFLLENLRLTAQANGKWFDRLELTARSGDRMDTGRKLRFDIRKTGQYAFTLKHTLNFDYFADNTYNFGANNRNVVRSTMNAEFRWMGIQHVTLVAGYTLGETTGAYHQPYSGWLDIYPIRLNRDTTRESFQLGVDFRKGGFKASLRQAWVTIEEASTPLGSVTNAADETFASTLTATRAGINESDIPTTKLSSDYNGNRWWMNAQWSHQDATMDMDSTDLKSYLFTDYGSRTDFLSTWFGNGEAPTTRAAIELSVMPIRNLTLSYRMDMVDTETTTRFATSRSMMLYGTGDTPLVTLDESFTDDYYYENTRTDHGLDLSYRLNRNWTLEARFSKLDGDIVQTRLADDEPSGMIDETYETTRSEAGIRFRHERGTLAVKGFGESIEDPTFRTAGDKRNGFTVTGDYAISDRVSTTLFLQSSKLENNDPLIQLSDKSNIVDLGIYFTPIKQASIGLGITRMDLDYASLLLFTYARDDAALLEGTDTEQTGYYITGNYAKERFGARLSLFYLDDSGTSLPLSTWNARMSLSWKFTDSLSALLSLRYLDYAEDAQPLHDYNLNQVVFGLRWIYR